MFSPAGLFWSRVLLAILAIAGLFMAWWVYPVENHYSILRCTISYLGSPDADRNPQGWRLYQAGMTSLILLMASLLLHRHAQFSGARSILGRVASYPIACALLMLLAAVWIPDSRSLFFMGRKATHVHTQLAIVSIPIMGLGLTLDAIGRFLSGIRLTTLWPCFLFALLVAIGFWKLAEWEDLCRADPTLKHWPGDGLHSTPLWEWILFVYLNGYFIWMARPVSILKSPKNHGLEP